MSGGELDLDAIEARLSTADWRFVAHARVDVPALVAEVRRLRAQVERVESLSARWKVTSASTMFWPASAAEMVAAALRD